MVVLNAVGVEGVALNACVGLKPTLTGMFATTWEILTGRPKATALTTAMGTEDLMRSERSQWGSWPVLALDTCVTHHNCLHSTRNLIQIYEGKQTYRRGWGHTNKEPQRMLSMQNATVTDAKHDSD